MSADVFRRPLPVLRGFAADFYGFLRARELRFQRCSGCGRWRHTPRVLCPACSSSEFEWARSSGRGRVFSWSVTHRPMHPAFLEVPYATVVIELDEGPRMLTWMRDVPPGSLAVGMRAEVAFEDVSDEVTLAVFRPVRGD